MPFMPVYMAKAVVSSSLRVLSLMGAIATVNPVWAFGPTGRTW